MRKILKSEDYDSYKILLPPDHLFGKRKQQYLYRELEKRHPCFSESFAYDVSSKLTGKGIICNVTVMDKTVLGHYKADYPKSSLFTEEKEKVFTGKKAGLFFVMAGMVLVILGAFTMKKYMRKTEVIQETEESVPLIMELNKETESIAVNLLMDTAESGGKIKSLFWSYDGFSENLLLELTECFPSDFSYSGEKMEIKFSPVAFKENTEIFSLDAFKKAGEPVSVKEKNPDARKKFFSEINRWFIEKGFSVLSEDYSSGKIQLSRPVEMQKKYFDFAREVDLLFTECGFSLQELKISGNTMELAFTDIFTIPFSMNIFETLSEINPVFFEQKVSVKNIPQKGLKKTNTPEKPERKKIGKISHENGDSVTFYKNKKGKIENE